MELLHVVEGFLLMTARRDMVDYCIEVPRVYTLFVVIMHSYHWFPLWYTCFPFLCIPSFYRLHYFSRPVCGFFVFVFLSFLLLFFSLSLLPLYF